MVLRQKQFARALCGIVRGQRHFVREQKQNVREQNHFVRALSGIVRGQKQNVREQKHFVRAQNGFVVEPRGHVSDTIAGVTHILKNLYPQKKSAPVRVAGVFDTGAE